MESEYRAMALDPIAGNVEASQSKSPPRNNSLIRGLQFRDALAVVVGIMIGSGIFASPGLALERSGSPGLCLLAWTFSGALIAITSTCYLELASLLPRCGGDFDYLKEAYGERIGFAFAWFNFWVSKTASQSIIATIFGRYVVQSINVLISPLSSQIDLSNSGGKSDDSATSKTYACLLIGILTAMNCWSTRESTTLQSILTALKLLLVLSLFGLAVAYTRGIDEFSTAYFNLYPPTIFEGSKDTISFGYAMIACLWSFDGWADLNFMTEELVNPLELPRILFTAIAIVTLAYLLANVAYLCIMSISSIEHSSSIAVSFARALSPTPQDGLLSFYFAAGVAFSTIGSANGSIMTGGRAFYAVARAGKAPSFLANVNHAGSPYGALLAQGAWTVILLLLPGSGFNALLDYFGPASWFFYALTSSAVITLRMRQEEKKSNKGIKQRVGEGGHKTALSSQDCDAEEAVGDIQHNNLTNENIGKCSVKGGAVNPRQKEPNRCEEDSSVVEEGQQRDSRSEALEGEVKTGEDMFGGLRGPSYSYSALHLDQDQGATKPQYASSEHPLPAIHSSMPPSPYTLEERRNASVVALEAEEALAGTLYRVPLYPLPPLLVILTASLIVISALSQENPFFCILAFGFIAVSVPVHMLLFER